MSVIQGFVAFLVTLGCLATPVVEGSPEHADPEALITGGRWSEAEAATQAIVNEDPLDAMGWYLLGRTQFERGRAADLDDAVAHLSRAVSIEPGLAPAWFWLGRASDQLAGRGNLMKRMNLAGRSREAFAKALELDPENFEYAYALIQFYLRAPAMVGGSVGKAEGVIQNFSGRRPGEKLLLEASVSLAGHDDEQVLLLLTQASESDDRLIRRTWKEIALHLGRRQLSDQTWDEAVRTFRLVTDRMPDLPAGYLGLSRALEGNGDFEGARQACDEHARLDP
jgi:tetratricopeptide (TPR) repeat protein